MRDFTMARIAAALSNADLAKAQLHDALSILTDYDPDEEDTREQNLEAAELAARDLVECIQQAQAALSQMSDVELVTDEGAA